MAPNLKDNSSPLFLLLFRCLHFSLSSSSFVSCQRLELITAVSTLLMAAPTKSLEFQWCHIPLECLSMKFFLHLLSLILFRIIDLSTSHIFPLRSYSQDTLNFFCILFLLDYLNG